MLIIKGKQSSKIVNILAYSKVSTPKYTTKAKKSRMISIKYTYKQLYDRVFLTESYNFIKSLKDYSDNTLDITFDLNTWISSTIIALKNRSFQFKPYKRTFFPILNKTVPLGIPSTCDKIVLHSFKRILEYQYEKLFISASHGFRPNKSTHTAIFEVCKWSGINWIIKWSTKGFLGTIDHHILESVLTKQIKDKNLIDLYWKVAKAGYIIGDKYKVNHFGVPKGGILSPILSNIYLHELDVYVEQLITKYSDKIIKPYNGSVIIRYNRYAEDWIIGISGPFSFAKIIKDKINSFLCNNMNLSFEVTKITNILFERVFYLGFELCIHYRKLIKFKQKDTGVMYRGSNSRMLVYMPKVQIVEKAIELGFAWDKNKPRAVTKWIFLKPEEIIKKYNSVIINIINYYSIVNNKKLFHYVVWLYTYSAMFTLARKLSISPKKVFSRYSKNLVVSLSDLKNSVKNLELNYVKKKGKSMKQLDIKQIQRQDFSKYINSG